MKEPTYVITYDVGTTGVKTCLFEIGEVVRLTAAAMRGYELYVLPDGGAEQEPAEWWEAMCASTREVLDASGMDPARISGVSFCSQMQGVVLVDKDGEPVRRAMSYMDQRAREELKKGLAHGPQIAGANVFKLLKSLQITGAVAASVKDPVWKYKWVQAHEPENFKRVHKWLDVKEFLICKMTGEFVMTQDSAFAALIYDIRKGKEGWSREMCDMLGVNMNHLAPIKQSTDKVGEITEKAASELGLKAGTAVFGGGGDASLIGVGAGALAQYVLRQNLLGCLLCSLLALLFIDGARVLVWLIGGKAALPALLSLAGREIAWSMVYVFPVYALFLWVFRRVPKKTVL